jgi:hypothetical protein
MHASAESSSLVQTNLIMQNLEASRPETHSGLKFTSKFPEYYYLILTIFSIISGFTSHSSFATILSLTQQTTS